MTDMFYFEHGGKTRVVPLEPGVERGRRYFSVALSKGRCLRVAGDLPEQVIPQLKVLISRGIE